MIYSILALDPYQQVHGIFTLIFVFVSILIGLQILHKYFSSEGPRFIEYIPLGLTYIFLSSAWWGPSFNFLTFCFTGIPLHELLYVILNNAFIPWAIICWIIAYTSLQKLKWQREIRVIFIAISLIWEIIFFIIIFIKLDALYTFEYSAGIYYSKRKIPALFFPIAALLTAIITGTLFGKKGLESQDKTIRWKGIFLIFAFWLFFGATLLDVLIPRDVSFLVILRLLLIFSALFYYLGFFMPEVVENVLIR